MQNECGFCETPARPQDLDRFGFCSECSQIFAILSENEIVAIQERVGITNDKRRGGKTQAFEGIRKNESGIEK